MTLPRVAEVGEGVYDITWQSREEGPAFLRGERRRSYLFDHEVPTLVDTCVKSSADALIAGIEATDVDPERLLISHSHLDHAGAIDEIVARYDVELWTHEATNLLDEDRLDVMSTPDRQFTHGETIGRFDAVHIGGHSPGSSAFVDEAAGIAVCGDVVSGSDRRGLPPGYLIHPPQSTNMYQPPEACIEAEENLIRLCKYDFEIALVHHGSNVFRRASEKLERYVSFEPGYSDPKTLSLHRSDRTGMPDEDLRSAFHGGE